MRSTVSDNSRSPEKEPAAAQGLAAEGDAPPTSEPATRVAVPDAMQDAVWGGTPGGLDPVAPGVGVGVGAGAGARRPVAGGDASPTAEPGVRGAVPAGPEPVVPGPGGGDALPMAGPAVPDAMPGGPVPVEPEPGGVSGAGSGAVAGGEPEGAGGGGVLCAAPDVDPGPEVGGDTGDTWGAATGRRQPVIANETTASIPVHLLFRDDPPLLASPVGVRRAPVPRSAQLRIPAPSRPAPPVDPRLVERPGPVLPGWAALVVGALGAGAGLAALWKCGALPAAALERLGIGPRPYDGIGIGTWAVLSLLVTVVLFALGGIGRGRVGYASVLTLFGDYRGSVRRTGLIWVSPLLLRRRVDVRLRHWRSEALPAVDASGTALRVVVLVVWRVDDTVRATLGVADHELYLRDQAEAAVARVLSQLPADAFNGDTHTLRDAEAVGDALTRMLRAECAPAGIEVYSAQPTGIEYAPEVASAMLRCRVAAIDAKHRDSVLTSVVDAVDDTVHRLTSRGLVELDDYERKALVRDLTVAFYTGRGAGGAA